MVLCAEAALLSELRGLNRPRFGVTMLQKEVVDKYRFFGHVLTLTLCQTKYPMPLSLLPRSLLYDDFRMTEHTLNRYWFYIKI